MSDPFELDEDKSQAELAAAASERSRLRAAGGIGENLANRRSFGEFFTGRFAPKVDVASTFNDMAGDESEKIKRIQGSLDQYKALKQKQAETAESRDWQKTFEDYQMSKKADIDKENDARQFGYQKQLKGIEGQNALALKGAERSQEFAKNADPTQKLAKLDSTSKGAVGSIASGLRALDGMGHAVSDKKLGPKYLDSNTPLIGGLFSDDEYTKNARVLDEVVGRLQSGGAIGKDELANFKQLGPRPADNPQVRSQKLADQKKFLDNKLVALGFNSDQLPGIGFETTYTPIETTPGQDAPGLSLINEAKANSGPKVGVEEDGHVFMGGDAGDSRNWKKLK